MAKTLLTVLLVSGILLTGKPQQAIAQSSASPSGAIPWFSVKDKAMVVQNGTRIKPLNKDVMLPNGIRVEYRTQSVVLTNGNRVLLKEGDMLSLNGEFIHKSETAEPTPARVLAPAPAPALVTTAPAPVAPASVAIAVAATAPVSSFSYRPDAPVNGMLRGVVELGASGFNMFIVRVDGKRNWKLEKSEFGNSLVMENMATEEDVRVGLKSYIGKMLDFGVAGRDIHFVVSSGAALAESTHRIVNGLRQLKYVVTTVTPEREGSLGLRAALPPPYADKAFLIDMGSANSKISWYEGGQPHALDTYGSKYYEKGTDDATVAAEIKAKVSQVPARLRGTCFIIGGVPYELAKAVRQGQESYTVLRPPNAYPQLSGAKIKSGLNIYQAAAAATGCQQFVFGYDTNFTIGYLLSLP